MSALLEDGTYRDRSGDLWDVREGRAYLLSVSAQDRGHAVDAHWVSVWAPLHRVIAESGSTSPSTPAESLVQYGVRYPDGSLEWPPVPRTPSAAQLHHWRGLNGPEVSVETAEGRGKFIDAWRQRLTGSGIDPDSVPAPTFVTRERVVGYTEAVDL